MKPQPKPSRADFRRYLDRNPPLEQAYVVEYVDRRRRLGKPIQIGEMMYTHYRSEFIDRYEAFLGQPQLWSECYEDGDFQPVQ